ncbi:MAG: helix-turn-helix transcriptional regulator [Ignavibacteriales bacterium]|nr:helix-turn-helix transcriptional regulator [Ignavibacteriales bacterium]
MGIPALPICQITLKAQKPSNIPQNPQTIGEHIRKRRLEQSLFQSDVARIIGVEETSIYNWESNRSNPSVKYIPTIIKFLGYVPDIFPHTTLGEKLIYYREIHGLSQKKLAMKLGVDQTTLRRWERNISKPSKKLLKRHSNFFVFISINEMKAK